MSHTIREAVTELQHDAMRWKAEIAHLDTNGYSETRDHLDTWIKEAERIIGDSHKPHA